jgi:hypothetical protein
MLKKSYEGASGLASNRKYQYKILLSSQKNYDCFIIA